MAWSAQWRSSTARTSGDRSGFGDQEPRPRRERLGSVRSRRAWLRQPDEGREAGAEPLGFRDARLQTGDVVRELAGSFLAIVRAHHAGRFAHDLLERRERDGFAVGKAPTSVPRRQERSRSTVFVEIGDQTGLPDARARRRS